MRDPSAHIRCVSFNNCELSLSLLCACGAVCCVLLSGVHFFSSLSDEDLSGLDDFSRRFLQTQSLSNTVVRVLTATTGLLGGVTNE